MRAIFVAPLWSSSDCYQGCGLTSRRWLSNFLLCWSIATDFGFPLFSGISVGVSFDFVLFLISFSRFPLGKRSPISCIHCWLRGGPDNFRMF